MTLRGRIKTGIVMPDEPTTLPDGTEVVVYPAKATAAPEPPPPGGASIWEKLVELEGTVALPPDAARKVRRSLDGADQRDE